MARKEKKVVINSENKLDRRETGYYSTPDFVGRYISERLLQLNSKGTTVLDPCCGKEELLQFFIEKKLDIDGIDIIQQKDNYECNFKKFDFIKYYCNEKNNSDTNKNIELNYDYYIANPPYNCHEVDFIKDNKKELKKYFSDVGVHNMYSMFISAIIDFAKEGAIIGLITHDSFLSSKIYLELRKKILDKCSIHEITMCPINLFSDQSADVRTSIVILEKGKGNQGQVKINNRNISINDFQKSLKNNLENKSINNYNIEDISLNNNQDNKEFIIECPEDIRKLFTNKRLKDYFRCITGISTGNDKLYLSKEKKDPFIVPFYKNPGKDRFYTDKYIYLHKDFIELGKKEKNFTIRNKDLLYKKGIICSSMGVEFTASKFPDESTFGVNTNIICEDTDSWWLLAYLNSNLVTYLVRGMLIRSNMITSGYIGRIPMIYFTDEIKSKLTELAKRAYKKSRKKEDIKCIMNKINKIVNTQSKISIESIELINKFNDNLIKST